MTGMCIPMTLMKVAKLVKPFFGNSNLEKNPKKVDNSAALESVALTSPCTAAPNITAHFISGLLR